MCSVLRLENTRLPLFTQDPVYYPLPLLALVFLEVLQRRDYDRYQSQRTVVL